MHLPNGFMQLQRFWRVFSVVLEKTVSSLYEATKNELLVWDDDF